MPTRSEIAHEIDHTVLAPYSPRACFLAACDFARANDCASVCVCPTFVKDCAARLAGSGIPVCTVIGFPHGTQTSSAKRAEAQIAIREGARELDTVVNIARVKSADWQAVRDEIFLLSDFVHSAERERLILKVIFENCYLTDEEKIRLCEICTEAGVDFVKTSTGYGSGGATAADVALMKAHIGPGVRIKAAGGIHTADEVLALRAAGAVRFGCSRTEAILAGFPEA